jgi:hypothetical protein
MRIAAIIGLSLLCLPLGRSAARFQTAGEAQSNQQKARAVLDRMIATLGGQAYLTVQDSYSEGRRGRWGHNQDVVADVVYFRYWEWPDKDRWEFTKQRDVAQLYLGDKAYEVTYKGSKELDSQKDESVKLELLRHRYALENILRIWINQPGTILLDEGPTLALNRMAERITIINASNESVTLLVLADSHLPAEKIYSIRDPQSRERDEEAEIYDNWRMVQGVNTPFNIALQRNGVMTRQLYIHNVTYNTHPPDSVFALKLLPHKEK